MTTHESDTRTLLEVPRVRRGDGVGGMLAFRRDQLSFLRRGLDRYGDVFRFRLVGMEMVIVNDPDLIRQVLVERTDRYNKGAALFEIVRPVLGDGLIVSDGELWHRQRRMMAPTFTMRTVPRFVRTMTTETRRMVDGWSGRADPDDPIDVSTEIGRVALRIVTQSLFSADVAATIPAFERAFATANTVMGAFFRFPFPPLKVPTPGHRRLLRATTAMDGFVSGFIDARLAKDAGEEEDADLLTLLMHAVDEEDGTKMDLKQLHDEVLNLCIAAFETTTNTLAWAFYLLARHPEVERALHTEVDEVLDGRVPTFEDVPRLTYTRMVIDEVLRIYSPAYQTMRQAAVDDELGGFRIPAGTNVLINSYFLHRHRDFWPDPEEFRPERFSPDQAGERPRHAYLPFGSGPRICIGKHFALVELVLVLATVARTHRLVAPAGAAEVRPDPLITLHPHGGVHLYPVARR